MLAVTKFLVLLLPGLDCYLYIFIYAVLKKMVVLSFSKVKERESLVNDYTFLSFVSKFLNLLML